VKVVAIGLGTQGSEEFAKGDQNGSFWTHELYVDHNEEVFPAALGGQRQGSVCGLLAPSVCCALVRVKAGSDTSKSGGDQYNLGGTLVVFKSDVLYEHLQTGFADHPSIPDVVDAAKSASA